jgi:hypothetical protein
MLRNNEGEEEELMDKLVDVAASQADEHKVCRLDKKPGGIANDTTKVICA